MYQVEEHPFVRETVWCDFISQFGPRPVMWCSMTQYLAITLKLIPKLKCKSKQNNEILLQAETHTVADLFLILRTETYF